MLLLYNCAVVVSLAVALDLLDIAQGNGLLSNKNSKHWQRMQPMCRVC